MREGHAQRQGQGWSGMALEATLRLLDMKREPATLLRQETDMVSYNCCFRSIDFESNVTGGEETLWEGG